MALTYDPREQKWSLYFRRRFYLWGGDPFDRAAAERIALRIMFG